MARSAFAASVPSLSNTGKSASRKGMKRCKRRPARAGCGSPLTELSRTASTSGHRGLNCSE
eukprot:3064484-Amphidinium_carterae.2